MDFINRAWGQLAELFKSLTPGARVVTGLLLALVLISLGYLFQQRAGSPDAYLMGGEPFSAAQLPAMEAAFAKAGLTGYEVDGNRVRVPRGQQAVFMGALAEGGALPPTFGKYLEKAVTSSNPWTSKENQRESIKIAKQSELQLIISSMRGVESASVLYDVQEKRGFGEQPVITASVSVKPDGSQPLEEERVPMLRHLVASAIAGLRPDAVTVVDLNGRHYPGGTGVGNASSDNVYGSWKKSYEQEWQNKIRGALAYIPGVVVTPNVELDAETSHEENISVYDAKTVVYNQSESTSTKLMKSSAPGGRPGVQAQGGMTQANQPAVLVNAGSPETNEESSQTETQNAIPTTTKRTAQHGMRPKRVTVAVAIPTTYYEQVWSVRNPTAPGQPAKKPEAAAITDIETKVKADVERAVVALLPPVPAIENPFPQVTVNSFQPIAPPSIGGPGLPDKALAWLNQYWTTLGMIGVAVFSLVMLRGMVRAVPATAPSAAAAAPPSLSLVTPDEPVAAQPVEQQSARSRLKRRSGTGPSLRDELAEIVREDPDTAVAILRNWIGTVG